MLCIGGARGNVTYLGDLDTFIAFVSETKERFAEQDCPCVEKVQGFVLHLRYLGQMSAFVAHKQGVAIFLVQTNCEY